MSSEQGDHHHQQLVPKVITVGSRKSQLALVQTHYVIGELSKHHPGTRFEIKALSTIGDNVLDVALSKIGEKSLFTRELEDELLEGSVDIVVHSLKDLPTMLPAKCCIGAITTREDPSDSIVFREGFQPSRPFKSIASLSDSVFATSSLRRISQLKAQMPEVVVKDVRGNINTRLAKLDDPSKHGYDCLLLATAGLKRCNLSERISHRLDWYHAVSQGALGIECRQGDQPILQHLLQPMRDMHTTFECLAERAFMCHLEGGCSVPIGVLSSWHDDDVLTLKGIVLSLDGSEKCESSRSAKLGGSKSEAFPPEVIAKHSTDIDTTYFTGDNQIRAYNAVALGLTLAQDLLELGAKRLLDQIRA